MTIRTSKRARGSGQVPRPQAENTATEAKTSNGTKVQASGQSLPRRWRNHSSRSERTCERRNKVRGSTLPRPSQHTETSSFSAVSSMLRKCRHFSVHRRSHFFHHASSHTFCCVLGDANPRPQPRHQPHKLRKARRNHREIFTHRHRPFRRQPHHQKRHGNAVDIWGPCVSPPLDRSLPIKAQAACPSSTPTTKQSTGIIKKGLHPSRRPCRCRQVSSPKSRRAAPLA